MGVREIEIAGKSLTIQELLDVCDPETGRPLTGSWLWESSILLAEWMASQGRVDFNLDGKTVVELGAGTGLPGLTAALLGAGRVILTDVAPLLAGLQKNVEVNGLSELVEVREVNWGSDELWGLGEVDLVLMSDVFFDVGEIEGLAKTLRGVCRRRETRVWAASEFRSQTGECLEVLKGEGFGVVEMPLPVTGIAGDDDSVTTDTDTATFAVFIIEPPQFLEE
ncbi:uncharacterized protein LOC143887276 [Tasmannia lanceolata]|uniref:uncharacterized protein LOC143887276 n=1 Tax=Tasmannia lanceolata TaxID=3420 RepID=UPI004064A1FE